MATPVAGRTSIRKPVVAAPYPGGTVVVTSVTPTAVPRTSNVPTPFVPTVKNEGTWAIDGNICVRNNATGTSGGGLRWAEIVLVFERSTVTGDLSNVKKLGTKTSTPDWMIPPP